MKGKSGRQIRSVVKRHSAWKTHQELTSTIEECVSVFFVRNNTHHRQCEQQWGAKTYSIRYIILLYPKNVEMGKSEHWLHFHVSSCMCAFAPQMELCWIWQGFLFKFECSTSAVWIRPDLLYWKWYNTSHLHQKKVAAIALVSWQDIAIFWVVFSVQVQCTRGYMADSSRF